MELSHIVLFLSTFHIFYCDMHWVPPKYNIHTYSNGWSILLVNSFSILFCMLNVKLIVCRNYYIYVKKVLLILLLHLCDTESDCFIMTALGKSNYWRFWLPCQALFEVAIKSCTTQHVQSGSIKIFHRSKFTEILVSSYQQQRTNRAKI